MGASLKAGGGGRGRGRRGRHAPMSEINVTPMVDVMLVLLITFMVAAPLLQVGIPVDRRFEEYLSRRRGAGHCRSAFRDRARPYGRHTCGRFL